MARTDHGVLHYFATLSTGRMILWCYLIWYLNVLVRFFDPSPQLWLTSLGISFIVGIALNISTSSGREAPKLGRWQIFRLFLMPFCVSSFSALVKGRGFVLIFDSDPRENMLPLLLISSFCASVLILRQFFQPERNRASIPNNS